MMRVSINLDGVTYYAKSYPFLDRMKTADDWGVAGPATEALQRDAQGYPKGMPAGATGIYTIVQVDPASAGTTRRYVVTWKGNAGFGFRNLAQEVAKAPGRLTIEVSAGATYLPIDVWSDPADPLRDMHIVREDQMPLFQAGRVFNPVFLQKLAPFDTIRTMDWGRTNSADVPSGLAKADNASWSFAKGGGVPLEIQVALANELGRNLWYNVPYQADDAYVATAVRYIRDNLKPSLRVYVEYSNELWNWSFPAATLSDQRGKPVGMDAFTWGGFRAAQVAQAAKAAWGADPSDRLRTVLGTQTSYQGLEQWHLIPGVQRVGDPAKLFDAYAVTTYFYGPLDSTNKTSWPQTAAWAKDGDRGLTAFLDYLEKDSLAALGRDLAYQAAVAKRYGWELVAYEGGQHLTGNWSGVAADDGAVQAMVGKALADPRMGRIYGKMVDLFGANGGTMLAAFNEAGDFWGALPDIYAKGSPRYDALVAAAKAGEAKPPTPDERVMARLTAGPPATSAELATASGASSTALTATLARLRKAGANIVSEPRYRLVAPAN